ncbi:MAG TPA: DUF4276 family protein [Candidatus Brocadiia bacterium]|nr:DUF4276 family protein [Candidatus Brocadiia bacterium]
MSEIVFFLEEASARAMLEGLLPRVLPDAPRVRYVVFDGKRDMENQLIRRMRGCRVADARFVVLRDQDSADCREVKKALVEKCEASGRGARSLVRIACRELESWYLADLAAVERGLQIGGLAARQREKKYRQPDGLSNAAEELAKLTKRQYQKVGGSRAIGPYLDVSNTRSASFAAFVDGLKRIARS